MKAWQILLTLLFFTACSRPTVRQSAESQSASSVPEPVMMKLASEESKKPEPPPIPKSPVIDFSEDSDALAIRRAREKAKRVAAAHAGAQQLQQVNLQALHRQAVQGNINAQVDLGLIYFEGQRVPKNLVQAQYWWTLAAQRGHPVAYTNLRLLKPDSHQEEVSFFGTQGKGSRFIFIIDKSGSMKPGRLQAAKMELMKTLKKLPVGSQFKIYFFNHKAEPMPGRGLLAATPQSIAWAEKWISTRGANGGTNPSLALKWAFELNPDTIWLLSDGQFVDDAAIIGQLSRDNADKAARINTLAFHLRDGELTLRKIAQSHGGTYRFVAP